MATTSSTKKDNQNVTRTKSIGRKPKQPSSVSSDDGSDQKPEKPLPNYLKPTISSRPDPVKFLKKNNNSLEDNQKLLRRRSFDRPPSSLTSPSTSSPRIQKTLNVSPSRPRDRPAVPREKPATALRSSSFHGSRGVPRGGSTIVKSSPVATKKSGLSSGSTSLKSKKEGHENVISKKAPEKEIALDTASLSSAQEDHEEEILKVESGVQVFDDIEQPKEEKENKEVHVEVVHADESGKENESGGPTLVTSPVGEDIVVAKEEDEHEEQEDKEERLINEDNSEEKIEEKQEQENNEENKDELVEEFNKKIDEDDTSEKVDIDMSSKEVGSVQETTEEKQEEVKEEKEVSKEEMEKVKEEDDKEKVKEEKSGDGKKREVVKGKTECSSAYNDVIASKMQENPRKNKVLALAGAFQTVIDYETAASK